MPTATTFDVLKAARDLEAAGVERRQAEAFGAALRQAAVADRDERATKAGIARVEERIDALRYESRFVSGALLALALAMAARLFGLL